MIYLLITFLPYEGSILHGAYDTWEDAAWACYKMGYKLTGSAYECEIVSIRKNQTEDAEMCV